MKKLTGLALLITVLMAQSVAVFSAPKSEVSEQAMTEAEIQALEKSIQEVKNTLESLNKERSSTESRIQKTDRKISELQRKVTSLESRLKEGRNQLKKLQSRQQALAAKTEKQKHRIASSLRSIYMHSNDSRLKLLLNQEDPEALSRQLAYLDYAQGAQLAIIQDYAKTIDELQGLEQQQKTLVARLSEEKIELDKEKGNMVRQQSERKKLLARIARDRKKSSRELTEMKQQHEQLQQVLASITSRQFKSDQPFTRQKGKMPWPVDGRVLYGFNQKRPDTRLSWPGVFIQSKPGVPVRAVHDGRVIFADWMRGYGLLTIVDHGNDYLTLYAHTEWVLKNEGDVVLAGEPLAVSGQSGGQTDSGVYFEVRKKGVPENPGRWLKR